MNAIRAGDESTRARMLNAAVETILDEGYYRASSNRIAHRAGVTWGVIQYHFGTREQLLLAVVRDSVEQLATLLSDATISGETIEERLVALADVIWDHYRRPEFLAHLQVLLNLSKDPRTGPDTVQALVDAERRIGVEWQRLVAQVIPDTAQRPDVGTVMFEIIRGVAIGEALMEAIPHAGRRTAGIADATRGSLLHALTLLVEQG